MDISTYAKTLPAPLKKSELNELIKEYKKTGDLELRNKIVTHNLRLAVLFVSKFYSDLEEFEPEDLVQIASIELVHALDGFNPDHGTTFSTFASACIKNKISSELKISKHSSLKPDFFLYDPIITSSQFSKEEAKLPILDVLKDEEESRVVENAVAKDELKQIIAYAKKKLSPLEFNLFKDLFIHNGTPPTLMEVGKKYNMSHQLVAQKKEKIQKLLFKKFKEQQPEM